MNEHKDLNADGRSLLIEITRQVVEGAARGEVFVEVSLGEKWQAGERNLSDAGGVLSWGFDDIQMQPSGGNVN